MAQYIAISIFIVLFSAGFWAVYNYAKNIYPSKTPWLVIIGWSVFIILGFINPLLAFLPFIIYLLFCLFYYKKQLTKAIQQFFTDFGIYQEKNGPASVSAVLGNCNWSCAYGKVYAKSGKEINFNWWQGYTFTRGTSNINGVVTTTTVVRNYLALSFPPGAATPELMNHAKEIADTSKATFGQKFRRFFVRSNYIPYLVKEVPDGHFVVAWNINPTPKHYGEKLKWLMENG
ncbi:MAG: hypothetical protein ABIX01_03200 [Chitinophagaceae bacterium]